MFAFLKTLVPNWLYIAIGAVAAVAVVAPTVYLVGHSRGDSAGYARRIAEQAVASAKAEAARKKDDVKIQGLSDYDLCVQYLGARGLPIDACVELRGLHAE